MFAMFKRLLFIGAFAALAPIHSLASPSSSTLLPLIPAETALIAGVEDPHNPNTNGHQLLVTVDNSFELDDWLALTGVDSRRAVDQLIWLAASSPRGTLREHALLAAGRFDRGHIFDAARKNGASSTWYRGIEALIVAPFAREQNAMKDTRWLAILDGQAAVFGTPWLVQRAIDRYAEHTPADPDLLRRVALLRSGVNSWNVLVLPTDPGARHNAIGQLPTPWRELLANADEVILSTRYGSTAHIDFSIKLPASRMTASAQQAEVIPRLVKASWFEDAPARIEDLAINPDRVEGSLALSRKQFDACLRNHSSAPLPSVALNAR
jgi:hypothetical protein